MKFKELSQIPAKELDLKLRQNRAEQMALRIKKSAGQLDKPHTLRLLRKDVARIQTALKTKASK
jgi:large subunit ribosomal protein L29